MSLPHWRGLLDPRLRMFATVFGLVTLLVAHKETYAFNPQSSLSFSQSRRRRRIAAADSASVRCASSGKSNRDNRVAYVALTREEGKNEKLIKALDQERIKPIELPCIEHADGPDYDRLADTIQGESWDYVVVTSPEAARVLASAWKPPQSSTDSAPKVAAVGKATEKVLKQLGISVAFCPSKATAKVLCRELPGETGCKILYPASLRAQTTLQDGLNERGFEVTRLNTYDTVTATWDDEAKAKAPQCRVACFASPSAIKGWLINNNNRIDVLAACIGETSAEACRKSGWGEDEIFYPEKPGIEGWVEAIEEALEHESAVTHS